MNNELLDTLLRLIGDEKDHLLQLDYAVGDVEGEEQELEEAKLWLEDLIRLEEDKDDDSPVLLRRKRMEELTSLLKEAGHEAIPSVPKMNEELADRLSRFKDSL
jgi:hypothetical protein